MKFTIEDEDDEGNKGRTDHVYWAVIEVMTAITCANFPAMPPLVRCVYRETTRKKTLASRSNGSEGHSNLSSNRFRSFVRKSIHLSQNLPTHNEENRVDGDSYSSRTGSDREKNNIELTKEAVELSLDPRTAKSSVHTTQTDCKISNTTSVEGTKKGQDSGFSIPRLFSLHPHREAASRSYDNAAAAAADTAASSQEMISSPVAGQGNVIHRTEEFRVERSMV